MIKRPLQNKSIQIESHHKFDQQCLYISVESFHRSLVLISGLQLRGGAVMAMRTFSQVIIN